MADPTPPPQPPAGSVWGNTPPAPNTGPTSGRRPSSRTGYPPTTPELIRSASSGSIPVSGRPESAAGYEGLVRSSSSGSLRPGRLLGASPGPRNPSREQLEPLPTTPVLAPVGQRSTTPRERSSSQTRLPRLPPVEVAPTPGRPGSGGHSGPGESGRAAVPQLDLGHADVNPGLPATGEPTSPPVPSWKQPGGVVPPVPAVDAANADTARGPVKWVPHTHVNPKHAKFCFICLHGRLEGQADGIDDQVKKQSADDNDLPSPVDMKEMGYLLSGGDGAAGRFRRVGADFERNNITALWLREINERAYKEVVQGMAAQMNADLTYGVDVKLLDSKEDDGDKEVITRLFTFSAEEQAAVDDKIVGLGDWCQKQEARLMDIMPRPHERPTLPEVEPPTRQQLVLLEYQPLVDVSKMKGATAADARDAVSAAGNTVNFGARAGGQKAEAADCFKVDDLPKAATFAEMPEFEVVPYPVGLKDIPKPYEPLETQTPARQPVEALQDPYQRAALFLPEFTETVIPQFANKTSFGQYLVSPPECAQEHWLSTTRSVFPDNNPEEKLGWGLVPPRDRFMPSYVDDPYLPPEQIERGEGGKWVLAVRGIWHPKLHTTDGQMVPPIVERSKELHKEPPLSHPDAPIWSQDLVPMKKKEAKIMELIPIIPLKSYMKFKPKKVNAELPDFLWNLVREDAAGQGLWDVVRQRHAIPQELRRQKEEDEEEFEKEQERERDGIVQTVRMEQAAVTMQEALEEANDTIPSDGPEPDQAPTVSPSPGLQLSASRPALGERNPALPDVKMAAPGAPAPPPAAPPPQGATGTLSLAATVPPPQRSPQREPAASPQRPSTQLLPSASPGSSPALQEHQQRVAELLNRGGEGRKVEELLSDDRFLDNLADKLSRRLGGGAGGPAGGLGDSAQQTWGTLATTAGRTMLRPDPPTFIDPADDPSKAQIPRALQGPQGSAAAGKKDTKKQLPATSTDVNYFTQEKMRGECYVRLLIRPEPVAARQEPVPYVGDMMNPDIGLISGTARPNLMVPPRPPFINEEGEVEEDDEFADFERNAAVAFSFVRHNRFEAVEALIQQEQEIIQAKDENGNNMLHVACQNDHRRIAKLLLKNGCAVNAQNARGNTPLHYCYQYNFMPMADYLIAHGADETIANYAGLRPAQGTGREDPMASAQKRLQTEGV